MFPRGAEVDTYLDSFLHVWHDTAAALIWQSALTPVTVIAVVSESFCKHDGLLVVGYTITPVGN